MEEMLADEVLGAGTRCGDGPVGNGRGIRTPTRVSISRLR